MVVSNILRFAIVLTKFSRNVII
uniref:Uncharacterized protein n=1 Tax=Arundo donax TaxID=35708 RepID=A0A0A8YZR4_ARUDO